MSKIQYVKISHCQMPQIFWINYKGQREREKNPNTENTQKHINTIYVILSREPYLNWLKQRAKTIDNFKFEHWLDSWW